MPVLISAHRCGARESGTPENSRAALAAAVRSGAEFVEFDVQCCADGAFVLFHNAVAGPDRTPIADLSLAQFTRLTGGAPTLAEALAALRGTGVRAHIDLKFPGAEANQQAARLAVAQLGAHHVLLTTYEDEAVAAIRSWSRTAHPDLLVGLSLGRSVRGLPLIAKARVVLSEFFPRRRYRRCDANLVVADHKLAWFTVAGWARRRGLPLLIWTVDAPRAQRRWLRRTDVWLLTTNYPARARALRDG